MGFSCGIIGLPNVGKSTLFNAITNSNVDASNYPFCTIEPNKGIVTVPDDRLQFLAEVNKSRKTIPAIVEFVDIAGLVAGASKGEGLGNKFLSHIREVSAIAQVVRFFTEKDITHIGAVDPLRDLEIINAELMLADLESLEKKFQSISKQLRVKDKEAIQTQELLLKLEERLNMGKMLNSLDIESFSPSDKKILHSLNLLTVKPMLVVANISEKDVDSYASDENYKALETYCRENNYKLIALSAKMEYEISSLGDEQSIKDYLQSMKMQKRGLDYLIIEGYKLLNLITFFTSGETESKAWTIPKGFLAPQAAGVIHSDFERGFIKAETTSFNDLIELGSFSACREKGKIRLEGKNYPVSDGDIFVFKFNV